MNPKIKFITYNNDWMIYL